MSHRGFLACLDWVAWVSRVLPATLTLYE
jgi:hypothetical protein